MKMLLQTVLFFFLAFACSTEEKMITIEELEDETIEGDRDNDGDGYLLSEDCDDNNSSISPSSIEICDGIDNDCDGEIDEGVSSTFYLDADEDGFGDNENSIEACDPSEGYVGVGNDCDDENNTIYPGAIEYCDGIDSNCDGVLDEDMATQWYIDNDGDGYGDVPTEDCSPGLGLVNQGGDCDDANPDVYPGALEVCDELDNDCDGQTDEGVMVTFYPDSDSDGYGRSNGTVEACEAPEGYVGNSSDCDDFNSEVNPLADEICDALDNDCDGLIDEESNGGSLWYADVDGDGYGDPNSSSTQCDQLPGYVDNADDCDDSDSSLNPDASEVCDGLDNDCNGLIDDGFSLAIYFYDTDGDGYGDPAAYVEACAQPIGSVVNNADCDDSNAAVHPLAQELCNGIDDDCDGTIDVGAADALVFYADNDGDGFGAGSSTISCSSPAGHVDNALDCNDSNANAYPGADEMCNGFDDDCDAMVDNNAIDALSWYADGDGDGYGGGVAIVQCIQPFGYINDDSDCNDNDPSIHPNASESCNGIDDDCNGIIDDGFSSNTYYVDADGDGYGDVNSPISACQQPPSTVLNMDDCDDSQALVYPGASEVCNGLDDNCDGAIDEGWPTTSWYVDDDADGYGDVNSVVNSCYQPPGTIADGTDCDDSDPLIYPNASEQCNNVDDDCNGLVDDGVSFSTYYVDADGDGFGDPATGVYDCIAPSNAVLNDGDCDDSNVAVNPLAIEACNALDDDCNGLVDDGLSLSTFYQDLDGDGFGDDSSPVTACAQPVGAVLDNTDCNDTTPDIYPNADEYCNGIDDDCDGIVDNNPINGFPYFQDVDGDGYGGQVMVVDCSQPSGFVSTNTDCDDNNSSISPGIVEVCNGLDDDCDGLFDEGFSPVTYYTDSDGDGYGDLASAVVDCIQPANSTTIGGDCDDSDSMINPGVAEVCNQIDDDCDGQSDEGLLFLLYYDDVDGDGYGDPASPTLDCAQPLNAASNSADCDDSNPTINPDGVEICNGQDDDCDGTIDVGASDATDFYLDSDGDSYGAGAAVLACVVPNNHVAIDGDCNDADSAVNPSAAEQCNGIDDNCDGAIDEGLPTLTWYADTDGDGFGDYNTAVDTCSQPSSTVSNSDDCDDLNAAVNPGAQEQCNSVDDDCNGLIDDNVIYSLYFDDSDGDGFGDPFNGVSACSQPAGMVVDNTDCNDFNAAIYPGASEYCDGVDEDCDTIVDNNPVNGAAYFADADGDGHGGLSALMACSLPAGHSVSSDDCDDSDPAVNPSAVEVCNGIDDDCDGFSDEGFSPVTYYLDDDNDGYGDTATATTDCAQPSNTTTVSGDCNDNNASVNPGMAEVCNQIDDDCDNQVDEGLLLLNFYVDSDGDGYGDPNSLSLSCSQPANAVADSSDCDDSDNLVNPDATEMCNGIDDDCDGSIDIGAADALAFYYDGDGDGYGFGPAILACNQPINAATMDSDCDDFNVAVNPGEDEMCNGVDDDCDGVVDGPNSIDAQVWYPDYDGDGYGESPGILACAAPLDHIEYDGDCDDSDANISPNVIETCDGIDNDCNGVVDDGASCPCTAASYGGSSYLFCTQNYNWWNAVAACQSYGNYQLAIITDYNENNWVTQTANSVQSNRWWWIGLSDHASENNWVWVDGSSLSYNNWSSNQPDNYNNEDCVHIYANSSSDWNSGDWNDLQCDLNNWYGDYLNYICKSYP